MLLIKRPDQGFAWSARFVTRARFIGCVGLQDEEAGRRLNEAFSNNWSSVRSLHLDNSPDDSCWFAGDDWWLSTVEVWGFAMRLTHQFRTRNDLNETRQTWSEANESAEKSTKLIVIPPLKTIWLQVVSWQTTNEFNS
jgi:hypothetical protein